VPDDRLAHPAGPDYSDVLDRGCLVAAHKIKPSTQSREGAKKYE
jgi:hypothetical protein